VLALMVEGRRRVAQRYNVSLEPEVQLIGEARFPDGDDR
jgi:UDP-N-acetylenolpyruvoylglucosamine reductase